MGMQTPSASGSPAPGATTTTPLGARGTTWGDGRRRARLRRLGGLLAGAAEPGQVPSVQYTSLPAQHANMQYAWDAGEAAQGRSGGPHSQDAAAAGAGAGPGQDLQQQWRAAAAPAASAQPRQEQIPTPVEQSTPLEQSLWRMHEGMTPEVEMEFVEGLRAVAEACAGSGGRVERASGCSGCSIAIKVRTKLEAIWESRYGIVLNSVDVVAAELNEDKRRFISTQHRLPFIAKDVQYLAKNVCLNTVTGEDDLVPFFRALDTGIPCVSRSPANCHAGQNVGCVQEGRSETGIAFQSVLQVWDAGKPEETMVECVIGLASKDPKDPDKPSDAEWMVEEFKHRQCWATAQQSNAMEFGSPVPRERLYWGILKGVAPEFHDAVGQHFSRVLNACKGQAPTSMMDIVTLDHAQRQQEAAAIRAPFLLSSSAQEPDPRACKNQAPPAAARREKESAEWKLEHKNAFESRSFPWPPNIEKINGGVRFTTAGLSKREVEAAIYLHVVFEPRELGPREKILCEYLDVNLSLTRATNGCFSAVGEVIRSPWRERPPTLTGHTKILMRVVRCPSRAAAEGLPEFELRAWDSMEYFRAIGWADSDWSVPAVGPDAPPNLLANLAGNAYSGWQCGAFQMALTSAAGKAIMMSRARPTPTTEPIAVAASQGSSLFASGEESE